MSRLLCAEYISRSPYLHIPRSELESASKLAQILYSSEPLSCSLRQDILARDKEIGISLVPLPANPASKLVELRQAQFISPVYYNSICRRYIKTGFYYGGAYKDIMFLAYKFEHYIFHLLLVHLTVYDRYLCLRDKPLNIFCHRIDALHPVMDKEYLPIPVHLPRYCLFYNLIVESPDKSLYGEPVLRRRIYNAQIPDAG